MAVKKILEDMDLTPISVELGEIALAETDISNHQEQLRKDLQAIGFDLLDSKRSRTIEKVKTLITELVQYKNDQIQLKLSDYLSENLHQDYSAISNLFSETEGITIEKYYILQKVEKVKELLVYDELTLNEIADRLNYSSAAYLSNQFKKVTGLTPGNFKKSRLSGRKPLDEL